MQNAVEGHQLFFSTALSAIFYEQTTTVDGAPAAV